MKIGSSPRLERTSLVGEKNSSSILFLSIYLQSSLDFVIFWNFLNIITTTNQWFNLISFVTCATLFLYGSGIFSTVVAFFCRTVGFLTGLISGDSHVVLVSKYAMHPVLKSGAPPPTAAVPDLSFAGGSVGPAEAPRRDGRFEWSMLGLMYIVILSDVYSRRGHTITQLSQEIAWCQCSSHILKPKLRHRIKTFILNLN